MQRILGLMLLLSIGFSAYAEKENDTRNVDEYNLQDGVGLKGYDPVSYFDEGGGEPQEGLESISLDYEGVTYFFASEENKELFSTDPAKYEPTYGGWCAWAMANNAYVDINPELFLIVENRIHFFVANRPLKKFNKDVAKYEDLADAYWLKTTGEQPRK